MVLPGVGNFSAASKKLSLLKDEVLELIKSQVPILGVCLGMQLFFPQSEEGDGRGLSIFKGKNVKLPCFVKIPHMGWNTLRIIRENELLDGVQDGSYVYFVHSLYPIPVEMDIICGETTYGVTFTSAIAKKNVYGTQFHPEKSSETGLKILKNFAKVAKR